MEDGRSRSDSQVGLTQPAQSSGFLVKVFMVVALLCVIIAVVAMILAAVAMGNRTPVSQAEAEPSSSGAQTKDSVSAASKAAAEDMFGQRTANANGQRTWIIAVGHDYGAVDYIDDAGYIKGIGSDMIRAVCSAAGMDCRTAWEPYGNCWQSLAGEHPRGGIGLHSQWYDACASWLTTIERTHVFQFSKPYLTRSKSAFYVKPGATFNTANVAGKVIGFLDGWAWDEKCLAREDGISGTPLAKQNIKHYSLTDQLKNAVLNGEVDAAFSTDTIFDEDVANNVIQKNIVGGPCTLAGPGMMMRKDSDFATAWNKGFDKIVANGHYKEVCDRAKNDHSHKGPVHCIST